MNLLGQGFQKLEHYRDTQTEAPENIATRHSRVVAVCSKSNIHRMTMTSFANNFLWSCCRYQLVHSVVRIS